MLTCREVAERAEGWIDQDLSRWAVLQMRLHLAMCKGCSRFIGQMRVTRDLAEAAARAETATLDKADNDRISTILSRLRDGTQTGG